jgi:uncharacterized RDD family membrane protein YckC
MSGTRFEMDWADAALTRGVLVRRFVAFLVDGLLLSVLCATLWVLLGTFGVLTLGLGLPLLGLIPIVPLLYNWLSVASRASATPGQALMGLRVRRDEDLGPPTGLQGLIWSVGFAITVSLGAIWFAIAFITVRHRTLHDLVSGLVVVRTRALDGAIDAETLTRRRATWNTGDGGPAFE